MHAGGTLRTRARVYFLSLAHARTGVCERVRRRGVCVVGFATSKAKRRRFRGERRTSISRDRAKNVRALCPAPVLPCPLPCSSSPSPFALRPSPLRPRPSSPSSNTGRISRRRGGGICGRFRPRTTRTSSGTERRRMSLCGTAGRGRRHRRTDAARRWTRRRRSAGRARAAAAAWATALSRRRPRAVRRPPLRSAAAARPRRP